MALLCIIVDLTKSPYYLVFSLILNACRFQLSPMHAHYNYYPHYSVLQVDNPQVQGIIIAISKGGSDKYGVMNPQGAKGKINILSSPICH